MSRCLANERSTVEFTTIRADIIFCYCSFEMIATIRIAFALIVDDRDGEWLVSFISLFAAVVVTLSKKLHISN